MRFVASSANSCTFQGSLHRRARSAYTYVHGLVSRLIVNSESYNKTSLTLLSRVKDNEPEAWAQLVQLYGPLVYSWSRAAHLQPADVADVAQEVFRVVQRKLDEFDPLRKEVGAFRSWLWGITRLKILDHLRRDSRDRLLTGQNMDAVDKQGVGEMLEEPPLAAGAEPQTLLIASAIRLVKGESESNTWDAFWRMAVQGETASEIAADLGMTAKAVRQAKFRVSRKLRNLLSVDAPGMTATEAGT